jgi:hypothetical protein
MGYCNSVSILELVYVVVGIIVGLGIAEILGGAVRVFHGELRGGLIHGLWALNIFLFLVQDVWGNWAYRDLAELTYLQYLIILASPIALYLGAAILFPPEAAPTETRLDDHILSHRRALVAVLLSYVVQTEVSARAVSFSPSTQGFAIRIAVALAIISILVIERRWWQRLVPALVLGLQLYWAIAMTPVLTGS